MTMKALFIGRFQPFHIGHLYLIQDALKKYDKIIIGIGSSQYDHTCNNPFTADERKRMIEDSLKSSDINKYEIKFIPDIHNYQKWVSHVVSIVPKFDVVLSNDPLTKRLFEEDGYKVEETIKYNRDKYCGNEIRRKMINNEPWEDLVPEPVVKIIKDADGINRLKKSVKKSR